MNLYIIRHGDAVDKSSEVPEDAYRYLTVNGRETAKKAAEKIKEKNVSFDIILTSPLVRAVQTAEITAGVLNYAGEIRSAIELIGGGSFERFLQLIKRNSQYQNIASFGHAPEVNNYTLRLSGKQVEFKKSAVCKMLFDTEKLTAAFDWILNPEKMEFSSK